VGLDIHGLTPQDIGTVQIAVLAHGNSYTCATLTDTCLRSAVLNGDGTWNPDLLQLKGDDGKLHRSYRPANFDPSQLTGASGATLNLSLSPGTNFLVVVEVLSPNDPVEVQASGCLPVAQLDSGVNKAVTIQVQAKAVVPTCEPRID